MREQRRLIAPQTLPNDLISSRSHRAGSPHAEARSPSAPHSRPGGREGEAGSPRAAARRMAGRRAPPAGPPRASGGGQRRQGLSPPLRGKTDEVEKKGLWTNLDF